MKRGPRLYRVAVEVVGIETATEFYSKLLGVEGRPIRGGRCYFDCGDVILALVDVASLRKKARPASQELYFAVADVDAAHARAKALSCLADGEVHGAAAGEVIRRPWGERSFYAQDPFGNPLCFVDKKTLFTGD